jgi:hypothetical protein
MNWFDRWIAKKVKQSWNEGQDEKLQYNSDVKMNIISTKHPMTRSHDVHPTLNFRLHHAENGWIVEVTNHDSRTDRHTTKLHLISEDQEFDQVICQIITLEALRS